MSNQTLWLYKLKDQMSGGLQKIEKTQDRVNRSILKTERNSSSAFKKMGRSSSRFGQLGSKAFSSVSALAPGVAGNLALVANPITAIAAAALAAGTVLVSATQKAAAFQNEFLELKNLNLDKTNAQIDALNKRVLDAAFFAKQGSRETSKAFFDVQSVTGLYGEEVDKVVRKIGIFSGALKVDFNKQVESSAVAMKNFGFGANQLDKFLASSFKTVQVGKVTFEELARVQTDFAGTATKAFQTYDSANQLFAVFSSRAKSAEEAATLTKSAFQDLFKGSTVKAFKKVLDINLFDPITGAPKQIEQIVKESNAKFKKLGGGSPEKINELVNQFKGSDGLVQLIGAAAFQGDEFIRTIDQFNKTDFNLNKALSNAKKDLNIVSAQLKNQFENVLVRIGQKVLPIVTSALSFVSETITGIGSGFKKLNERSVLFQDIMFGLGKVAEFIGFIFGGTFDAIKLSFKSLVNDTQAAFLIIEKAYRRTKAFLTNAFEGIKLLAKSAVELAKLDFTKADKFANQAVEAFTRKVKITVDRRGSSSSLSNESDKVAPPVIPNLTTLGGSSGSGLSDSVAGVVSKTQTRNVTITINKLVETLEVKTTNIKSGAADIQRQIEEVLVRAIRDAELAIS